MQHMWNKWYSKKQDSAKFYLHIYIYLILWCFQFESDFLKLHGQHMYTLTDPKAGGSGPIKLLEGHYGKTSGNAYAFNLLCQLHLISWNHKEND